MKKTIIIILSLIVLLNTVGLAWAGRGSNGEFSVPIFMALTFLGMVLLLISSGYLIVKKYLEEKKEKEESITQKRDGKSSSAVMN